MTADQAQGSPNCGRGGWAGGEERPEEESELPHLGGAFLPGAVQARRQGVARAEEGGSARGSKPEIMRPGLFPG